MKTVTRPAQVKYRATPRALVLPVAGKSHVTYNESCLTHLNQSVTQRTSSRAPPCALASPVE